VTGDATLTGPLFDGRAADWTRDALKQIQDATADYAHATWDAGMEATFRINGHVYQSFARVTADGTDAVVNDGYGETNNLPYGLWLEGVGSRNSPVTRFPGYHNLRQAYVATDRAVPDIAAPHIDALVDRINHE
jgi:hypothetical protein